MPGSHNVDSVFDDVKNLIDSFGFTTTVEGKTMGLDCAGIIADGIIARSIDEQRGADGPWDKLTAKYIAWKARKGLAQMISVRTGGMMRLEALLGSTVVTNETVQMLYGTGEPDKLDPDITDIEKAFFFSKRRPFYELDDTISDLVFARIEHLVEEYIRRSW
jgi:hypothetical protein